MRMSMPCGGSDVSSGNVTLTLGNWQATILGGIITALTISVVYAGFQMRDNVQANTADITQLVKATAANNRNITTMRDRVNTLETRVAIIDDRMQRAQNAVWHPPMREPAGETRLVWLPALRRVAKS